MCLTQPETTVGDTSQKITGSRQFGVLEQYLIAVHRSHSAQSHNQGFGWVWVKVKFWYHEWKLFLPPHQSMIIFIEGGVFHMQRRVSPWTFVLAFPRVTNLHRLAHDYVISPLHEAGLPGGSGPSWANRAIGDRQEEQLTRPLRMRRIRWACRACSLPNERWPTARHGWAIAVERGKTAGRRWPAGGCRPDRSSSPASATLTPSSVGSGRPQP